MRGLLSYDEYYDIEGVHAALYLETAFGGGCARHAQCHMVIIWITTEKGSIWPLTFLRQQEGHSQRLSQGRVVKPRVDRGLDGGNGYMLMKVCPCVCLAGRPWFAFASGSFPGRNNYGGYYLVLTTSRRINEWF